MFKKATSVILAAQEHFLKQSNQTSITLYWEIGKLLAKTIGAISMGGTMYERLSHDLTTTFKNACGYSFQNLRRMRQFYSEYVKSPELLEIAKKHR